MWRFIGAAGLIGAVALASRASGLWAQTFPAPHAGTGVVTVTGSVEVANTPAVLARQAGEWQVTIASLPPIALPPPGFLQVGGRYAFVWPNGRRDVLVVREVRPDGWLRAELTGTGLERGPRWVNPSQAALVEVLDRAEAAR
ncbi:MAG TPA: hypothetical protein VNI83_05000 [Vicinamibacterales bacterium]|nr:hypothetical protein [Vicinamibacterales bacterium]